MARNIHGPMKPAAIAKHVLNLNLEVIRLNYITTSDSQMEGQWHGKVQLRL